MKSDIKEVTDVSQLVRKYGKNYFNEALHENILQVVKNEYQFKDLNYLLKSRRLDACEARMFCYVLTYNYGNMSQSYRKVAARFNTKASNIHTHISKLKSLIKNPSYNLDISDTYERLRLNIEGYVSFLEGLSKQPAVQKQEEKTQDKNNIELETTENKNASDLLDIPDVNESPFDVNVIDRNVDQGFAELFKDDIKEAEVVKETPPVKNIQPTFQDQEEIDQDEDEGDDVGAMEFNNEAAPAADLPPEIPAGISNWSSKSIIDIVNLILPGTVSEFVVIDETLVSQTLTDVDLTIKEKAFKDVRSINKEHKKEIERTVKSITPYLEKPLKETLDVKNIEVSPTWVLIILCGWLGVSLFLTCRKMSSSCKSYIQDLEVLNEKTRRFNEPSIKEAA